jgi:hypothetical protein
MSTEMSLPRASLTPLCSTTPMARKVASTALSKVLYVLTKPKFAYNRTLSCSYRLYILLFPSSSLALILNVPTRSQDNKTIFLTWAIDEGDPDTIYVQTKCDISKSPFNQFHLHTSDLHVSLAAESLNALLLYVFDVNSFSMLRATQDTLPRPTVQCTSV